MGTPADAPLIANYTTNTSKRRTTTTPNKTQTRLYKYHGQHISPTGSLEPVRQHVRRKTIQLLKFTSRLRGLTHDQMREIMDAEISGNIGYHARSVPMTLTQTVKP